MARKYSRDARGRFSGGGSGTAPRTMKTALARTVAPRGTISKRKDSRDLNRGADRGPEQIGNLGPWILRQRPRRLPGSPLAPAKLRTGRDGTVKPVAAAGMRRRGTRTRRAA